jgi:hypothetical protein
LLFTPSQPFDKLRTGLALDPVWSFYSFISLKLQLIRFCLWREILRICKPNEILSLPLCWGWSRALASSVELVFSDSDRSSFNL